MDNQSTKLEDYKPLSLLVYEKLRESINIGEFRPGCRIVVDRVSAEYGVSKIPVREALQKLAAEGLVKTVPNKGVFVSSYTPREVEEIYAVRACLEPYATRLAAEKITESDLHVLEGIHSKMTEVVSKKDYQKIIKVNLEFHKYLFRCSGNYWLYKTLMDLWERTRRSNAAFIRVKEHNDRMYGEHQKLMSALRNKDVKAAEEIAKSHINAAKRGAKEYAEKWGNT